MNETPFSQRSGGGGTPLSIASVHSNRRGELGRLSAMDFIATPSALPPSSPMHSIASPQSSPGGSRFGSPNGSAANGRGGGAGGSGDGGDGDHGDDHDDNQDEDEGLEDGFGDIADRRTIWGTNVNVAQVRGAFSDFILQFRGQQEVNEFGEIMEGDNNDDDPRGLYQRALENLAVTKKKVRSHPRLPLDLILLWT